MSQPLTPALIAGAACPPGRAQVDLFDTVIPGLSLRVTAAGKKTFTLMYRANGQRLRVTLGSAATMSIIEARQAARAVLSNTPAKPRQTSGPTVDDLFEAFRQRLGNLRPATRAEYERYIKVAIEPAWRGRLVASLTRADIFAVTDKFMKKAAPIAANRIHALIGNILRTAVDRGWLQSHPASGIRAPGGQQHPRERVLSLSEAASLWLALDREKNADNRDVLRLALLLGQRRREITHMTWSELDFGEKIWRLPAARSKNRREHTIPLPTTALAILEARIPNKFPGIKILRWRSDVRLFPNANRAVSRRMQHWSKWLGWRENATVHDLRRTCATMLATLGTPRHILKSILGHVDRDVTAIYDRAHYSKEKAQAMQAWDDLLMEELRKITPVHAAAVEPG